MVLSFPKQLENTIAKHSLSQCKILEIKFLNEEMYIFYSIVLIYSIVFGQWIMEERIDETTVFLQIANNKIPQIV